MSICSILLYLQLLFIACIALLDAVLEVVSIEFDFAATTFALSKGRLALVVSTDVTQWGCFLLCTLRLFCRLVDAFYEWHDVDALLDSGLPRVAHFEEEDINVHFTLLLEPDCPAVNAWFVDGE